VTPARLLRQNSTKRQTFLAIVPLSNEAAAFDAYRLLQYHGISPEHLAIVGQGYSSPDRVGLLEPMQIALHKARRFALITGTAGSVVGLAVFLALHWGFDTSLTLTLMLLIPTAGIVGGFSGAVVGALFGFLGEGTTVGIYHHHVRQGGYLLMMEGSQPLVRRGEEILKQYSAPKAR
jgi:hypothetical protein